MQMFIKDTYKSHTEIYGDFYCKVCNNVVILHIEHYESVDLSYAYYDICCRSGYTRKESLRRLTEKEQEIYNLLYSK